MSSATSKWRDKNFLLRSRAGAARGEPPGAQVEELLSDAAGNARVARGGEAGCVQDRLLRLISAHKKKLPRRGCRSTPRRMRAAEAAQQATSLRTRSPLLQLSFADQKRPSWVAF